MLTEDVTWAVKQREELKTAKFQAEQASVAKSEFLASMSHEIRTPLNGIIGFTDLLLKTNLSNIQSQYLNIVYNSASALLSVINDILDFSKIEAGKLELDIERCDIFEILSQAVDIIALPVQKKGLEMLVDVPMELDRFVWVDEVRLKQVIINLLSNAAKFTEEGEIELKMEAIGKGYETVLLRFSVRDTGIGVHEIKQKKIFAAFSQEDGTITKKYGGTGLGLTISNQLLAMMGSRLQLVSKPNQGSTFFFDLDVKSEQGEPVQWEQLDFTKKILIVDDNAHNRTILRNMLQLLSIQCDVTDNGQDALSRLVDEHYEAIIMDYHMPEMDGLETIKRIRQRHDNIDLPIILLTSSSDNIEPSDGIDELKISHCLTKPVKLSEISHFLSRLREKTKYSTPSLQEELPVGHEAHEGTVIVAEDNPANMFLVRTILGRILPLMKVISVDNGFKAVEACEKSIPDLIFMDIQMPELNGYDATKKIRQLAGLAGVPIIALTAGNVKGERERCIEAGMNDFIPKPFVEQTLRAIALQYLKDRPHFLSDRILDTNMAIGSEHFDLDRLRQAYQDDKDFISEFLLITKQSLISGLNEAKTALNLEKWQDLRSVGHKMKGAAAMAYLPLIAELSAELERLPDSNYSIASDLLSRLDKAYEVALPMIEALINP